MGRIASVDVLDVRAAHESVLLRMNRDTSVAPPLRSRAGAGHVGAMSHSTWYTIVARTHDPAPYVD